MKIFFVSLRTALIYGPVELIEVTNPEQGIVEITCVGNVDYHFEEWEGYAVVVPEKEQVWGAAKPVWAGDQLKARFQYTPMPIPGKERKLFLDLLKKSEHTQRVIARDIEE